MTNIVGPHEALGRICDAIGLPDADALPGVQSVRITVGVNELLMAEVGFVLQRKQLEKVENCLQEYAKSLSVMPDIEIVEPGLDDTAREHRGLRHTAR